MLKTKVCGRKTEMSWYYDYILGLYHNDSCCYYYYHVKETQSIRAREREEDEPNTKGSHLQMNMFCFLPNAVVVYNQRADIVDIYPFWLR